jgi:pilus assembly protein Flp/PilA
MNKLFAFVAVQVARISELAELKQEEGQTLAEYALILALIAAVVVAVVAVLGGDISSIFTNIGSDL